MLTQYSVNCSGIQGMGRGQGKRERGKKCAVDEMDCPATGEGHCGLPRAELIDAAAKVLEVEAGLVEQAIAEEVAEGTLVEDESTRNRGVA
jgi:hypothetical protein